MLSAKSDSVVEVALLRAEYERKQEIMQAKQKEMLKKDLEKGDEIEKYMIYYIGYQTSVSFIYFCFILLCSTKTTFEGNGRCKTQL